MSIVVTSDSSVFEEELLVSAHTEKLDLIHQSSSVTTSVNIDAVEQ